MADTAAAPAPQEAATVAEAQNAGTEAEKQPDPAQEATEGAGVTADPAEQEAKEKQRTEEKERERKARKAERVQRTLYEENAVLRAELARHNASPQGAQQSNQETPNTPNTPDPVSVARQLIDAERFNARCNTIAEQGAKEFKKDFMPAWDAIASEIPIVDRKTGKPTDFFESITDLDNPAAVIVHIGTNPDLLDELQDLTGRKLDRKLALIEAELKAKPKVSNAPIPITPIKPRSTPSEPDPADTDAWIKAENKRRAAMGRR
jgi:hypothetical protein